MKKLLILAALASAVWPSHAENISIGDGTYNFTRKVDREITPGVRYTYFNCSSRGTYGTHVYVTEVDLTNPNVKIEYLTAGGTMGGSTKSLTNIASANTSTNHKVVAGANANFWITSEQPWKSQLSLMPHGTAVAGGKMYSVNPASGRNAHMGGPAGTGSIVIGKDGRAYIKRFQHQLEFYHPRINHVLDICDINRVCESGSAVIYNRHYGTTKAFKPVNLSSSNTWTLATGDATEVYLQLAPGETEKVGGDTKYVIKAVKTNAGGGTVGNFDMVIVGRDVPQAPYASVLRDHYKVGDEIIFRHHFNSLDGATKDIIPNMYEATSGNLVTMEAGTILTDAINAQSGYNGNNYARTLYATNNAGTKLWIIVCGNKTSTYYGLTTSQITHFAKYLGATYASQVDCGGSSQMYVDGSQVNKSTDAAGVRNVHSGIFVVSTGNTVVADPTLTTTAANKNFGELVIGGSSKYTFNVAGTNLKSDITIAVSGTDASAFKLDKTSIAAANQSGNVTVTFSPSAAKSYSATLTISTSGVTAKTFTLTGSGKAAVDAGAIYQDNALAYGVTAPASYTLETEYADRAIPQLAGTTVKRVIARGDIAYILGIKSDNTAVIVVYDHVKGEVVRTLDTSTGFGSYPFSDIAITSDGYLIATNKQTIAFSNPPFETNTMYYFWGKDANGVATGQAGHWNIVNLNGNWSNGIVGETMTFQGPKNGGLIINSARNAATTGSLAFLIRYIYSQTNSSSGQLDVRNWRNNQDTNFTSVTLGEDYLFFPSPFGDDRFIINGPNKAGAEVQINQTDVGVFTKIADISASVIPGQAAHTSMFRHGGKVYMVAPSIVNNANNGFILADITNGIGSATAVGLNGGAIPTASTIKVATVGTSQITHDETGKFLEGRLVLLAVRNGAITKLIEPTSIIDPTVDPAVIVTDLGNTNLGQKYEYEDKTLSKSFRVEGQDLIGDVIISSSNPAFVVSPSTISMDEATEGSSFSVIFNGTTPGTFTSQITISSRTAESVTATVTATVKADDRPILRHHYAYNLQPHEVVGEIYRFRFHLTGDASNVRIHFNSTLSTMALDDEVSSTSYFDAGPKTKGENIVDVPSSYVPREQGLKWHIEVMNSDVDRAGLIAHFAPAKLDARGGVVVINDPTSPMYGYIVASNGYAQGFDIYTPTLEKVGNYQAENSLFTKDNRSSLYRLTLRDNGIVYAIDYADRGAGIYAFNPQYPEYGVAQIFQGTKDNGGCWTYNGTALGGGGSGLCFTGSGANTKLWSFQEDYPKGNAEPNILCSWNIGESNQITMAPTSYPTYHGLNQNGVVSGLFANRNVNLVGDGDHGLFVAQVRSNGGNSKSCPGFVYMTVQGDTIYNSGYDAAIIPACGSGLALNNDRTLLAVSLGVLGIRIYNVTWGPDGRPSLTVKCDVPDSQTDNDLVPQLAFDPANNVYAYQQSKSAAKNGLSVYSFNAKAPTYTTAGPGLIDGTVTGVEDVNVSPDEGVETIWYDIRGVRVDGDALVPGLYLKVTGNKVEKVRVP